MSCWNSDTSHECFVFLHRLVTRASIVCDHCDRRNINLQDVLYAISFENRCHIGGIFITEKTYGNDEDVEYEDDDVESSVDTTTGTSDVDESTSESDDSLDDVRNPVPVIDFEESYRDQLDIIKEQVSGPFFDAMQRLATSRSFDMDAACCLEIFLEDQWQLFSKMNSNRYWYFIYNMYCSTVVKTFLFDQCNVAL